MMSVKHLPWAALLLAPALASAGCASAGTRKSANAADWDYDASFGQGASDDGSLSDAGARLDGGIPVSGDGDGDSAGAPVRVRMLHGLVNIGSLVACHDPDFVADDPSTAANEQNEGPEPAEQLPLGGSFGAVTGYLQLSAMSKGAVTFHRPVPPEAADAGVSSDAGAVIGDAGAPPADAGVEQPDAAAASVGACDPSTREAILPLPFTGNLLDPAAPTDLAQAQISAVLGGGQTITLLASGVALDGAELARRQADAAKDYLAQNPGKEAAAVAAGYAARAQLDAEHGPRVVPALQTSSELDGDSFALSLAHLVPDVPTASGAPGALALCIKVGDTEPGPTPGEQPSYPFRARLSVGALASAGHGHTFRVFAAEAFAAEAKGCAGTSLAPVAELVVPAQKLVGGHAYTLAALGAIAPDELCNPVDPDALARAGCPDNASTLGARLVLIDD